MLKMFAKLVCLLFLLSLILSCGDVNDITDVQPGELSSINRVLRSWRDGYQNEDLDMYMSTFWDEGFLYTSDMGTQDDATDDVIFEDIREERDSARRVFASFQDIEIELSEPPDIQLNTDRTQAEVRNHYRIQGFVADGESLEQGYTGWFAEGDNVFTFELRTNDETEKKEWRITEWFDEAFSEEQIRVANNL
jgi:ketosteroid isomerase-like protein